MKAVRSHAIRFILVGTLNTAFSYLIYAGLLFVGFDYKVANLLTLMLGVLFSFKTQGHLVFNNPDNRLLGRFILSWAFIYVCVTAVIGKIINLGFDAYWAGAMALPFSVVLSYLTQRYFVFRKLPVEKA